MIGPLKMPPYRSRESSSLAHGNGSSCSYFTGKHRVLVVTPTYSGGAMQFKIWRGVGNLMSSVIGGAKAPDTLDGKWDQITTSPNGRARIPKGRSDAWRCSSSRCPPITTAQRSSRRPPRPGCSSSTHLSRSSCAFSLHSSLPDPSATRAMPIAHPLS